MVSRMFATLRLITLQGSGSLSYGLTQRGRPTMVLRTIITGLLLAGWFLWVQIWLTGVRIVSQLSLKVLPNLNGTQRQMQQKKLHTFVTCSMTYRYLYMVQFLLGVITNQLSSSPSTPPTRKIRGTLDNVLISFASSVILAS